MSLPMDHTGEQALDALSVPTELTPGGVSRRKFLTGLGAGAALATVAGPSLFSSVASAADAPRNLVVFLMTGGNDGFSTLIPTGANPLDALRPLAMQWNKGTFPMAGGYGFNRNLPALSQRYNAGQVAVVGGVGCSPSMSHFDAMDEWLCGSNRAADAGSGWIGRWLDTLGPNPDTPLLATSLTGQVPQLHIGRTTAGAGLNYSASSLFGSVRRNATEYKLFQIIEDWRNGADPTTAWGQAALAAGNASELAGSLTTLFTPSPSQLASVAQGAIAARLLNNANYGCRTVFCSLGGFDVHADLVNGQTANLAEVDKAVDALFDNLQPAVAARTAALVFSEFGRRAAVNGSNGVDHGTANYAFLVGPPVKGGMYGSHLNAGALDSNGNVATPIRHFDLIGTTLKWLGADADAIIGTTSTNLGVFR